MASDAEEALGEVIAEAWELRRRSRAAWSPDDARRALSELRKRHRIAGHVSFIKIAYDGAVKTIEDPAAKGRRADVQVRNLAAVS